MQDVKKGNIRYIANTFPSYGYLWNYGAMPQTWEDPDHVDSSTKYQGQLDHSDGVFFYVDEQGFLLENWYYFHLTFNDFHMGRQKVPKSDF